MYCPDCGFLNRPGAKYCAACQAPLGAAAAWKGPLPAGEIMDDGRFRIIRPLGKGGMGAVYLAENLQAFGRQVVVKEMLDYFDPNDPQQALRARQRFEDEARILAELKHPAVPDIYGYFSHRGRNYLVMEYIVGEDLEAGVTHRDGQNDLVPALPYSRDQIVLFGLQLCDLLDYLSNRLDPDTGEPRPVIHHDIKPANVIRDPETDRVWLVDFGTARARFDPTHSQAPSDQQESVYGTVGYAPPEQYHGESEPRSDVYALAATLYHLLTDDDPRDHPFQFDRLESLELDLRLALQVALEQDVAQRAGAAALKTALTRCMPDQPAVEAHPLAFPDGRQAQKLSDLPTLAQDYWDYTRDILYSGDLEHWLRRSLHNPVVAETAKRVTTGPLEPDAALDTFLRELDPRLPSGQLELARTQVDMGLVSSVAPGVLTVELKNNGRGYSHGAVSSPAKWLRESDGRFGVKPGGSDSLVIEADTGQLQPGKRYQETLTLTPADGSKPLRLRVALTVAEPRIHVNPEQLEFDLSQGPADVQQLTLHNSGGDRVTCTLSREERWLVLQPKSLTLPAGQSATVKVTLREDRLPPVPRPRTHILLGVSRGVDLRVPVQVLTGRRSATNRLLLGFLALILLGLVGGGIWYLARQGAFASIVPPTPTPTPQFASGAAIDDAMVTVGNLEIDRYEVTNLQYAQYASGYSYPPEDALLPVVDVSWEDAKLYCESRGEHLPTADEWLSVAQGDESWLYPWGNQWDAARLNSADNRETDALMPIGNFPTGATPSGVMDLLGNASEWVIGPPDRPAMQMGGSWQHFGLNNNRQFWETPQTAPGSIGFRCIIRLETP